MKSILGLVCVALLSACSTQTGTDSADVSDSPREGEESVASNAAALASPAKTFDVFRHEVNSGPWAFTDMDAVPWARAARSAVDLCRKSTHGFDWGHYTGYQLIDPGIYQITCGGLGTFTDVHRGEIADTGWDFESTNTVAWAQAGRAATKLCEVRGFVGGQFTGYESGDGLKYGLVCYKEGAQGFNATSEQLADTGYPVGDTNHTPWAHAARAASRYCERQGFVGGFLDGHQYGGLYHVICQR